MNLQTAPFLGPTTQPPYRFSAPPLALHQQPHWFSGAAAAAAAAAVHAAAANGNTACSINNVTGAGAGPGQVSGPLTGNTTATGGNPVGVTLTGVGFIPHPNANVTMSSNNVAATAAATPIKGKRSPYINASNNSVSLIFNNNNNNNNNSNNNNNNNNNQQQHHHHHQSTNLNKIQYNQNQNQNHNQNHSQITVNTIATSLVTPVSGISGGGVGVGVGSCSGSSAGGGGAGGGGAGGSVGAPHQNYNNISSSSSLSSVTHNTMGPTVMNGATQQTVLPQQLQQQQQQQQQTVDQQQQQQQYQQTATGSDQLSKTNVYIRGLPEGTTDKDLVILCSEYGTIVSAKAIFDKTTKKCKGYGFVDFESPLYADNAVKALQAKGIKAQMAKVGVWVLLRPAIQQEQDPTNLYITNLPPYFKETDLVKMLSKYGNVVSTKILVDAQMNSRGVGFARMETREKCEQIIQILHGTTIPGANEPLAVKFADSGSSVKKNLLKSRDPNARSRLDISTATGMDSIAVTPDPSGSQQNGSTTTTAYTRFGTPQLGSYPLASSPWIPGYMMTTTQPATTAFENQYLQLASSPQHLSVSPYKPTDMVNTLQAQNFYLNGTESVMPYGAMFPPMGPLQYISPTYPYYATAAPPIIPTIPLADSSDQSLSTAASPNGNAYTQFLHPLAHK